MTLGDLLRQDGALSLLIIGAAIGFLVGMFFFRVRAKKEAPEAAQYAPAAPPPAPLKTAAVIAAITAAVNKYQDDNVITLK